jgi:hypothetical protein
VGRLPAFREQKFRTMKSTRFLPSKQSPAFLTRFGIRFHSDLQKFPVNSIESLLQKHVGFVQSAVAL